MFVQAGLFLLDTLAGFVCILLLLRFYMQALRVSFRNPLGGFVVQATNWLVLPLRRVLPGLFGLDLSCLLPAYLLQAVLLLAVVAARGGLATIDGGMLAALILGRAALATLRLSIYLLIGALILQAVLSWVNPYAPIAQPLAQFTRPFLDPIRRFVPPIASIDVSPLIAIVLAQLALIFL